MKLFMSLVLLTLSFASFASTENFECNDNKGVWAANFSLNGEIIENLIIVKNGNPIATRVNLEGNVVRFLNTTFYEFSLGGSKYFDFDRYNHAKSFEVHFILTNNPLAPEKVIKCQAI